MYRVLFAPLAILFERKLFGCVFLILGGVIVATRALFTAKMYCFSHAFSNMGWGGTSGVPPRWG